MQDKYQQITSLTVLKNNINKMKAYLFSLKPILTEDWDAGKHETGSSRPLFASLDTILQLDEVQQSQQSAWTN
jgi:hypothetical protein